MITRPYLYEPSPDRISKDPLDRCMVSGKNQFTLRYTQWHSYIVEHCVNIGLIVLWHGQALFMLFHYVFWMPTTAEKRGLALGGSHGNLTEHKQTWIESPCSWCSTIVEESDLTTAWHIPDGAPMTHTAGEDVQRQMKAFIWLTSSWHSLIQPNTFRLKYLQYILHLFYLNQSLYCQWYFLLCYIAHHTHITEILLLYFNQTCQSVKLL